MCIFFVYILRKTNYGKGGKIVHKLSFIINKATVILIAYNVCKNEMNITCIRKLKLSFIKIKLYYKFRSLARFGIN